MLMSWECFSYFLILPPWARTEYRCSIMTRNTPEILPYCRHCGRYKGVGTCDNPECDKTQQVDPGSFRGQFNSCVICSTQGEQSCYRCGHSYCSQHSVGKEDTKLTTIDQHLGTCFVCGKIICEHCWIFNNGGLVTCLAHREIEDSIKMWRLSVCLSFLLSGYIRVKHLWSIADSQNGASHARGNFHSPLGWLSWVFS